MTFASSFKLPDFPLYYKRKSTLSMGSTWRTLYPRISSGVTAMWEMMLEWSTTIGTPSARGQETTGRKRYTIYSHVVFSGCSWSLPPLAALSHRLILARARNPKRTLNNVLAGSGSCTPCLGGVTKGLVGSSDTFHGRSAYPD